MRIRHNPLIFRGKPSDQFNLKGRGDFTNDLMDSLYDSVDEDSSDTSESMKWFMACSGRDKKTKEEISVMLQQFDDLYDLMPSNIRDLLVKCYGVMPVAPKFDFFPLNGDDDSQPDQPCASKLWGIPDFRGDFIFVHPRVCREAGQADESIDWLNMTVDQTIEHIWPKDPNGGYMHFAAQISMPRIYWNMYQKGGAYLQKSSYNNEKYLVPALGSVPDSTAYIFYSENNFTCQMNAFVKLSKPGAKDDVLSWEEYTAAVMRVIPKECYMPEDYEEDDLEDQVVSCMPLSLPELGLDLDLGDPDDKESGCAKFMKQAEKLPADFAAPWDLDDLSYNNPFTAKRKNGVYPVLTIGGEPSSQQEPRRPWDMMAGSNPKRMAPFVNFEDRNGDLTHQIYLSGYTSESRDEFFGYDDQSCT